MANMPVGSVAVIRHFLSPVFIHLDCLTCATSARTAGKNGDEGSDGEQV